MHLQEDELVLHYYGEMDAAAEARAAEHLAHCGACHVSYTRLQRVLAAVDAVPVADAPEGFERIVWARLEPNLQRFGRLGAGRGWLSWFVLSPARLAWVSAVVVLVVGAFFAGRLYRGSAPAGMMAADVRERILLVDLGEHLDRSQIVLVEIATAGGESRVDISRERALAEELVAANRLYRHTAVASGDAAIAQVLDDIESVLVDLAAAPATVSAEDLTVVQRQIHARDLLFKLRTLSAEVRDRQKQPVEHKTL